MRNGAVAENFGTTLRRHRLAASLTQEALAERAGISATAIAALERGRRRAPRLTTLRQLGEALGLDAAELADLSETASMEIDPARAEVPANNAEFSRSDFQSGRSQGPASSELSLPP